MIRDTPCLAGKVQWPLTRDSGNTLRQKVFAGGRLAIVGANSPAGLASRRVRIVVADEVDRFPVSAGSEGDPLALASKRQGTFWNRKTLIGSTPTLKETSAIWREWSASDMQRYQVPCHGCGHTQALIWANVRWDKAPDGKHLPQTAHYICEGCGSVWTDTDRHDAVAKGQWVASKPGVIGVAGFHITGLLSPWVTMADIVQEFLVAKTDESLLQVWTNTVLGEPFEPAQETVEGSSLLRRGENYGPQSIPGAVKLLTAGVDLQGDRIEVQILGFGAFEETWAVRYEVLPGDPAQRQVWELLDGVLAEPYRTDAGRELRVRVTCVDSGGHHQHQVLSYCGLRRSRGVLAIKGVAGPRPIWPARSSRTRTNARIFMIGVDTGKDVVYSRLRIPKPGPGYIHFPIGSAFDAEYFAQLTSEAVQTRFKEGRPYRVWVLPDGRHNEALDTAVYGLAARHATRIRLDLLPRPALAPSPPPEPPEGGPRVFPPDIPPPPPLLQRRRRGRVIILQPVSGGRVATAADSLWCVLTAPAGMHIRLPKCSRRAPRAQVYRTPGRLCCAKSAKAMAQWPGFPLIFINSDDIREIRDHMADDDRRPKTIAFAHCARKFKIEPFGRVPTYCSASCRSMAFAKNNRGVRVSPEDRQRLSTWELLKDAGFVPADMPLPPRRKREGAG